MSFKDICENDPVIKKAFDELNKIHQEARQREEKQRIEGIKKELREKFKGVEKLKIEEIIFHKGLSFMQKVYLIEHYHNYTSLEAEELIETGLKEEQKRKLTKAKRAIKQKANELYGEMDNTKRELIPDDVKEAVWRRDQGQCVQCNSNEKLEFDHIIPVSKGGSSTARNIQLLCEKCNREKSNKI